MNQEAVTYLTNLVIAVILAGPLTQSWLGDGRSRALGFWALGAWTLAVAALLFALRPELPAWFGRFGPTWLGTLGQAALFLGAWTITHCPLP